MCPLDSKLTKIVGTILMLLSSPRQSGAKEEQKWRTDGLMLHNHYRQIHGVPPLELDEKANLTKLSIDQWYSENDIWNYAKGECDVPEKCRTRKYGQKNKINCGCGHFTQIVWKASKKLGLGLIQVKSGDKKYSWLVARYEPSGNIRYGSWYLGNVTIPKSSRDELEDKIVTGENDKNCGMDSRRDSVSLVVLWCVVLGWFTTYIGQ